MKGRKNHLLRYLAFFSLFTCLCLACNYIYSERDNPAIFDEKNTVNIDEAGVAVFYELWSTTWGTTQGEWAYSIATDSNDSIYVTGVDPYGVPLVKFNSSGAILWNTSWGGVGAGTGQDIVIDSNDDVIIAGDTSKYGAGNHDVFVLKFNRTGDLLWNVTWGGSSWDEGISVTVDKLDDIYVTGRAPGPGSTIDMFVLKYNSTGDYQWEQKWGGGDNDFGTGITTDSNNDVYVSGFTYSYGYQGDMFIVKYDTDGNFLWDENYNYGYYDNGRDVGVDSDDNVYFCGVSRTFSSDYDLRITKINATGSTLWSRSWGNSNDEDGNALVVDERDNVYILGTRDDGADQDLVLVKYDKGGTKQGEVVWGGGNDEYTGGLAMDSLGNVCSGCTAFGIGNGSYEMWLSKYDASGPFINITSPGTWDLQGPSAPNFTVEIEGPDLNTSWYRLNGGIEEIFSTNGTFRQDLWDNLANGTVSITFYANDTYGNTEWVSITNYIDNQGPIINILNLVPDQIINGTAPELNVSVFDGQLQDMWYTLDGGLTNYTFTTNSTINQTAWDGLLDGNVTIDFYANDSFGNLGSDQVTVIKDDTTPDITINYPFSGQSFGPNSPYFNVSVEEIHLDEIWYSINGGVTNFSVSANGTINQTAWEARPDGIVTIEFYANDTVGNLGFSQLNVSKDGDAPFIIINSPVENEIIPGMAPGYNVSFIDSDLDSMWYTLDGGLTNFTIIANSTINQVAWNSRPDGNVTIIFYANDIAGGIGLRQVIVVKDSVNPVITINSPSTGQFVSATAPDFEVNIADLHVDKTWYSVDGGLTNYSFTTNGTINQTAWDAITDGPVTITFYANDSAGNLDLDQVDVVKDSIEPAITINYPTGGEWLDTAPSYNVEISDIHLDTMWYTLGGTFIFTTNGTINQTAWDAQPYNTRTISFYANDSAGNVKISQVSVRKITSDMKMNNIENYTYEWTRIIDTSGYDSAEAVDVDPEGNVYITGYVGGDEIVVKYDPAGNQLWNDTFDWFDDEGEDIAFDSEGNVFICGDSSGDTTLRKYNSTGSFQWMEWWTGFMDDDWYGEACAVDSNGNIWTTGYHGPYSPDRMWPFILKYNPDRNLEYRSEIPYSGGDDHWAYGMAADNFGNVYIGGYQTDSGNNDIFISKRNPGGSQAWARTWGSGSSEYAYDVATDSIGNVYIAGATYGYGAGQSDMVLLKYNTSGDLQWYKLWGGSSYDTAYGVDVDAMDNIYVTGRSDTFGGAMLIQYNTSGDVQWFTRLNTSYGYSIAKDESGYIYVAGRTSGWGTTNYGIYLMKYTKNEYAPQITSEQVAPLLSNQSTLFNFSLVYTDLDNTAPEYVNAIINGTPCPMEKVNVSDRDYTDGCAYQYLSYFAPSQYNYTYSFNCSDWWYDDSTTTYGDLRVVETNIFVPRLESPQVTPINGSNATLYTFEVWYLDDDNNLPQVVNISIDGVFYNMTPAIPSDNNAIDGILFQHEIFLDWGYHQFQVQCYDGSFSNSTSIINLPEVNPFLGRGPDIGRLLNYEMILGYPYSWIDARVSQRFLGNDGYSTEPLQFNFEYYGVSYSTVYLGANGYLSFTDSTPNDYTENELPSSYAIHTYLIAPFWDDLDPADGTGLGTIWVYSTPDYWVAEWFNIGHWVGGYTVGTFEVILLKNGDIIFNYDYIDYTADGYSCGLNYGINTSLYNYYQGLTTSTNDYSIYFKHKKPYTELISPENNTLIINNWADFEWTSYAYPCGPVNYTMQISNTSDFSMILKEETCIAETLDTTSATIGFDLQSGIHYWRVRPTYGTIQGNWTNISFFNFAGNSFAPTLTNGSVSPASGYKDQTNFTFSVNYTDADNNAPAFVNVTINSTSYTMVKQDILDNDYTDGCIYVITIVLDQFGTCNHSFQASDGVTLTSDGPHAGPIIEDAVVWSQRSLLRIRIGAVIAHGEIDPRTKYPTFVADLVYRGATITGLNVTINATVLVNYDILWFDESGAAMSSGELDAIQQWVNEGGRFIITGDNFGTALDLSQRFNITINSGTHSGTTSTIFSHEITYQVNQLYFSSAERYLDISSQPNATLLAKLGGYDEIIAMKYGNGSFVIIMEDLPSYLGNVDNHLFLNNTFGWLGNVVNDYLPELSGANVTPYSGDQLTLFNFTVVYTDLDNRMPVFIDVVINGTPYSMEQVNPMDSNYTDGCLYSHVTYLFPSGINYSYYFNCTDGKFLNSTPVYSNLEVNETNNFIPELQNPQVFPSFGTNSTTFNFTVWYHDADYLLPDHVNITINSQTYPMLRANLSDNNATDGVLYFLETTLDFGYHQFQVNCSDGVYTNSTSWMIGPEVNPFFNISSVVSLITPSNNSALDWDWNDFSWASLDVFFSPVNFTFQISNLTNFSYLFYNITDIQEIPTMTNITLPLSIPTGTYYWRVRANYGPFLGNWSEIFVFNYTSNDYTPVLSGVNVTPLSGDQLTQFNFTVTYTDLDGYPPSFINVVINGTPHAMLQVIPADTNFTDGCIYQFGTFLLPEINNYTYFFECSDGKFSNSTSVFTDLEVVETNYAAPELLSPQVSPLIGDGTTLFNFSAWYHDIDNNLPAYINVTIDSTVFSMIAANPLDFNATDGILYYYNTTLSYGNHQFQFNCSDGTYGNSTTWIPAPDVNPFYGTSEINLLTPSNGSSMYWFSETFIWSSLDAPISPVNFTFQISNSTDFSYLFYNISSIPETPSTTLISNPLVIPEGIYYWRVRPTYGIYTGNWSEIFSFTFITNDYPPELTQGGVNSWSGDEFFLFFFSVNYTDMDNLPPDFVHVIIDGVPNVMFKQNSSDNNYTDGCIYLYLTYLPVGMHNFSFNCSDLIFSNSTITYTGLTVTPFLGAAPSLLNGVVVPGSGDAKTIFHFSVEYFDAEDNPPTYVNVVIDGTPYLMGKLNHYDFSYTDGCVYVVDITLPPGDYYYYFECSDGLNNVSTAAFLPIHVEKSDDPLDALLNFLMENWIFISIAGVGAVVVSSILIARRKKTSQKKTSKKIPEKTPSKKFEEEYPLFSEKIKGESKTLTSSPTEFTAEVPPTEQISPIESAKFYCSRCNSYHDIKNPDFSSWYSCSQCTQILSYILLCPHCNLPMALTKADYENYKGKSLQCGQCGKNIPM